jgi:hypothetical protein
MPILSVAAVSAVGLFGIVSLIVLLAPDRFLAARRTLICPETRQPAAVRLAIGERIRSLLAGRERLRVRTCSRWPERQGCGEECLLQVDLQPQLLERELRAWCEGRDCALCGHPLVANDWRQGRFSGVDGKGRFVPAAEMPLQELPLALENYRPVCWNCHCAQRGLRLQAGQLPGGRRSAAVWAGE